MILYHYDDTLSINYDIFISLQWYIRISSNHINWIYIITMIHYEFLSLINHIIGSFVWKRRSHFQAKLMFIQSVYSRFIVVVADKQLEIWLVKFQYYIDYIYTICMYKYSFILLTFIIFFDTIIQTPKEVEYEKKKINIYRWFLNV